MDDSNYQYNKEDVEIALRFLRLHLPKYATPENAIKVLMYGREQQKALESISSDEIEKTLQDLENH